MVAGSPQRLEGVLGLEERVRVRALVHFPMVLQLLLGRQEVRDVLISGPCRLLRVHQTPTRMLLGRTHHNGRRLLLLFWLLSEDCWVRAGFVQRAQITS